MLSRIFLQSLGRNFALFRKTFRIFYKKVSFSQIKARSRSPSLKARSHLSVAELSAAKIISNAAQSVDMLN